MAIETAKLRTENERLATDLKALQKIQEETQATLKKEQEKLKTELRDSKRRKSATEKELRDLRTELEKAKGELKSLSSSYGTTRGLSAYERQKAADHIKEEVEKLHKQNFELQKQLLDAKRAGDEAAEVINRNERKWTTDKDEVSRKLRQDEKIHKAEISAVTMRFENKQKLLEDEVKGMTSSVKQLRKERKTLQERLDDNLKEVVKLRVDHAESSNKLETTVRLQLLILLKL